MDPAGSCYPSLASIAKAARVSKDTAIRAIRDLETAGWISREVGGSPPGGQRASTRYLSQMVRPVADGPVAPGAPDLSQNGARPVADRATRSIQGSTHEGAPAIADDPPAPDPELVHAAESGGLRAVRELVRQRRTGGKP
jgi:DNA-binding transcriptional MocR family regulator